MARRTTHQRESDLQLINLWYLQGRSQRQIVEDLTEKRKRLGYTISQATVSKDLATLRKRWQEETRLKLDEHRAKELARIDLLEMEYWIQYRASKKEKVSTTTRTSSLPDRNTGSQEENANDSDRKSKEVERNRHLEVTIHKEKRTGNPAYLQGVERCIALRCRLLGLEAPVKFKEVTWEMQAIEDIKAGLLHYPELVEAFDDEDLVQDLFRQAGVKVVVQDAP